MKRLFIVLLVVLAGCSPSPKYQFVAPKDPAGQACIATCDKTQDSCRARCSVEKQRCDVKAQDAAQNEYNAYANSRSRSGRTTAKTEGDFYGMYRCSSEKCEKNCAPAYRGCYKACGGQITPL